MTLLLNLVLIVFILLETANVVILYFAPESKYGNGISVFKEWEKSKDLQERHLFVQYLVAWVAGTKLIFIFLLWVILFTGSETTKIASILALIVSIASYYWKLHPIIKKLDGMGEISPKGYSKTLGKTIGVFIGMFVLAILCYFLLSY